MSNNLCSDSSCTNGNCPGCQDGELWCKDPRCFPYCRGCPMPKRHDEAVNYVIGGIIIILFIIVIVLLMFYGPRFAVFHDGDVNDPYEVDRSHGWGLPTITTTPG